MFSKVNELAEEIFMYKHTYTCVYAYMQAGKKINRIIYIFSFRDDINGDNGPLSL